MNNIASKPSSSAEIAELQLPEGWELRRVRHLVVPYGGIQMGPFGSSLTQLATDPTGFKLYGQQNTISGDFAAGDRWLSPEQFDSLSRYRLEPGDIVLTRKGSIGNCRIVPPEITPGIADSDTIRIRLRSEITPEFFQMLLHSTWYVQEQISANQRGAILGGLNSATVGNLRIALPPVEEQHAIMEFLDEKTAALDALIAKRERHVELLEERLLVGIWERVTKGLDPRASLQDSRIPWVGCIPVGWSVAPLFTKYEVQLGKMLNPDAAAGDEPLPYLRNADVQWDSVEIKGLSTMNFTAAERAKFRLRPGDLLVCEGGEVGRTAIWKGELNECYYQKALHRVRPRRTTDNARFFFYLMRAASFRGIFLAEGNKSTIVHLTAEKLRAHRFPFPPREEQDAIVAALDKNCAAVEVLKQRQELMISKLREYRQTLISAAVTGQIPVREEIPA